MKDQKVGFQDIIELSEEQQAIIVSSAPQKTMAEWRKNQIGVKIPLNEHQQQLVLKYKNDLISGRDERTLLKDKTIIFSDHSQQRIAMRVEGVDPSRPPKVESILLVIELLMESDVVDNVAEWKGHKNLIYTLIHNKYDERFRVCVTFEKIGTKHMKVITVSNQHIDQLVASLGEIPSVQEALAKMMRRIVKEK